MTILDIAQSMKGRLRDGLSPTQSGTQPGESEVSFGTATADSSGGFVSIIIDGAPTDDPDYDAADYTFTVPCDSPVTAGDRVSYISDAGRAKAVSVATLSTIAQNADAIATATDQHFWADTNGVHVSTDEDDPTGAQNIVMNSAGVLLREGSDYLAAFTPSAVAFYDGNGNDPENITATFGSGGAIIGKSDTAQAVMSGDGFSFYDDTGVTIAEMAKSATAVSETVTEKVFLQTSTFTYIISHTPASGSTLDVWISGYNIASNTATFAYGTSGSASLAWTGGSATVAYDGNLTITATGQTGWVNLNVTVTTGSYYPPYFTFGTRKGTAYPFSVAAGRSIKMASSGGLGCGQYNADDGGLLQVGNGTNDNSRSNAMSVASNGTVTLGGSVTIGTSPTTSTTIGDIITAESGITISAARAAVWGKVCQLQINCTRSTAISSNATVSIGTVKSAYRPVYTAGGASNYVTAWLDATTGSLTARNITGAQIAANTAFYIGMTFILP